LKGDAGQASDPAAVAVKVQAAFSKRLINELKKTKIRVTSADSSAASNPPAYVLTVRGAFTAVKQGNMGARMMIGFGRGASDVKAHVIVSLVAPGSPVLLAEFDLESVSGKKPGAAATMGVGSAAASVGTSTATDSKASVEGDTTRMAKTVATEIEDLMVAQQWIVLCSPNGLWRLRSPNYPRTFGYTFGYRRQFALISSSYAKLQVEMGLASSLITLDYAYLS